MGARLRVLFEIVASKQYKNLLTIESFRARWHHSKTGKLVTHLVDTIKRSPHPQDNPELYGDLPHWRGVELKTPSQAYDGFRLKPNNIYLVVGAHGVQDAVTLAPKADNQDEEIVYRYG